MEEFSIGFIGFILGCVITAIVVGGGYEINKKEGVKCGAENGIEFCFDLFGLDD